MQAPSPYRTNRDLFANHYLDELLPETDAWAGIDDRPTGGRRLLVQILPASGANERAWFETASSFRH